MTAEGESMRPEGRRPSPPTFALLLALTLLPLPLSAQGDWSLFPTEHSLPVFLAGPREPVASGSLLAVSRNPNELGTGVEVEVSLGNTLPVLLRSGGDESRFFLLGLEAGVYARFGLQILERELIATDWVFTVPAVWHRPWGWLRFRYYHTSSHMGDEYSRRFENRGVNFSRDAADLFALLRTGRGVDVYGGARYGYNVKPEDSRRWVLRGGVEREWAHGERALRPWVAADVEWDQDAGDPRLDLRFGTWLLGAYGHRNVRAHVGLLVGPSPLGQFQGKPTTQIALGLVGHL